MTAIRVQYDAYTTDSSRFYCQDSQTYLIMDFSTSDFEPDSVMAWEAEQAVLADRGVRMSNPMTGVL